MANPNPRGLQFLSTQQRDRQDARAAGEIPALQGDTELSDESVLGQGAESLRDGGFRAPSYAARPAEVAPPLAGEVEEEGGGLLPSVAEEAQRTRAKERAGIQTAASLVGQAPGEETPEDRVTSEETTDVPDTGAEGTVPEDARGAEDQNAQAMQMRMEQLRADIAKRSKLASAIAERIGMERIMGVALQSRGVVLRGAEDLIDFAAAWGSIGLSLLLDFFPRRNLQMFSSIFFKKEVQRIKGKAPVASTFTELYLDQTKPETYYTCCCNFACFYSCLAIIAFILAIGVLIYNMLRTGSKLVPGL